MVDHLEQLVVGNHDQRVDLFAEAGDSLLRLDGPALSLERERPGDNANRQSAERPSNAGDHRRAAGARTAARTHPRGLTKREEEILELLSEGQSNEEISAALYISVRTVEHHVSAILGKLGVETRKGAAKEARRFGLTHPDRVSASGTSKSR